MSGKVLWHAALAADGIRLYDNPGGTPVRLTKVGDGDPRSVVSVRYRPTRPAPERP
jgi:hypothetical protein